MATNIYKENFNTFCNFWILKINDTNCVLQTITALYFTLHYPAITGEGNLLTYF